MEILVYTGPGVGERSAVEVPHALRELCGDRSTVRTIDSSEARRIRWRGSPVLFVMPGGRDLPYCAELNGEGNRAIARFVREGGAYLGLCAGAYYAASRVEFDSGGPHEVTGTRELNFFDGVAAGPVLGREEFSYEREASARACAIVTSSGERFSVYYDGGCTFLGTGPYEVLARYADLPDQPPAIVLCRPGEGRALLSGVHFELSAAGCRANRPDLADELARHEAARLRFLHESLRRLGLAEVVDAVTE